MAASGNIGIGRQKTVTSTGPRPTRDIDQDFIEYANSHGATLLGDYTDPFTGQTLGPST
ncbi:hypothetical protein [Streptomyces sp. SID4982]|uniref:hypothetical protein n=1 Tax=Streptomyces sp. SID4982 TaxID=2690291 RepID=UPI00136E704F|nr:hypothetical protein [Streptomyces sp. SID4982]MYS15384.1 hypothetical protein [Streptomyces sp. SID4982]